MKVKLEVLTFSVVKKCPFCIFQLLPSASKITAGSGTLSLVIDVASSLSYGRMCNFTCEKDNGLFNNAKIEPLVWDKQCCYYHFSQ